LQPVDPELQREFAVDTVRQLRARGYEALFAGGCVRDRLLGRTPKDYDVATSATPEEIREVFGRRRTIPVGAAFGVITLLGPKSAGQLDVATFREDKGYSDSRHPDAVEFSTPQADAQRRDFTINGLFYDPIEDRVIDFVGGQDDMKRRVVRAIGQARARFAEDKLRLLRAVRFAATYDFTLEAETRSAMVEMAAEVTLVSAERIAAEMRMMLVHSTRAQAIELARDVGLLDAVLPELTAAVDAWTSTLAVLARLDQPTFPLALAALLHAAVAPQGVADVAARWKLSKHDGTRTQWLVAHQHALVEALRMPWSRLQPLLVAPGIAELIALHEAIATAKGATMDATSHCRRLLEMPAERLNPPPLVTGDDLIAHGVTRGRQYHDLLEAVRDAQLDGKIETKEQALTLVDRLLSGD
jgi:tRNA nucleotidyltransferase/poly(A) polymerase